jgi:hypothetical protein
MPLPMPPSEGTLCIWDAAAASVEPAVALRVSLDGVEALAFDPEGRRLAFASAGGSGVLDLYALRRLVHGPPDALFEEAARLTGLELDGLETRPVRQRRLVPTGDGAPR